MSKVVEASRRMPSLDPSLERKSPNLGYPTFAVFLFKSHSASLNFAYPNLIVFSSYSVLSAFRPSLTQSIPNLNSLGLGQVLRDILSPKAKIFSQNFITA